MNPFDEQIKQRQDNDQHVLEDTFFRIASVVMDKWNAEHMADKLVVAKEAIDEVLKYYHLPTVEIPEEIKDAAAQLQYALRPSGLMTRQVRLDDNWQSRAYGPMLGYLKDTGMAVALVPGTIYGYYYKEPGTGKRVRVTRKTARLFSSEALCFYRPLPMKKLGVPDLLLYMKNSISRGDLILIVLATLAVTLVGKIEPHVYSILTGQVLQERRTNLMGGVITFLLCSAFASQMLGMVRTLLMSRITTKTSQAVEASVMIRILSLPVSFFRKYASGDLASRANCVNSLCGMILNNIFSVGLMSLMSLLYITDIFHFAPALVWPSIIIIVSTVVLNLAAALLRVGISRKTMKLSAQDSGMRFAVLNGMQKIRLSGSEKRIFSRWGNLYAKEAQLQYNPPMFLKMSGVFTTAISLFGTILLYCLAVETAVAPSQYYAFTAAYGRVMGAFSALSGILVSVASIKPVLEMAEPILNAEPEVAEEKTAVTSVTGNMEVNHVSFRYEENAPYVLEDLSLKIKAGEYVAIVGRTGCGKSTLIRLLLGFEKPEKGTVFYDQHDLSAIDPRSLRKHIGVVMQSGQLFQGDIFSNITISAPHLTLKEAWEAAEMAGLAQDIREMPMGMHTMISEGQGGISGGQKQRLMIARAIAPRPKILIFDEATSALDNMTQKQVSEALDGLQCTRIVIAHRLSTIRNCDRILVMDKGAIIEEGKYEDLIAQNGVFADLVARQRLDAGT